jgi:hypothetical protein
MYVLMDGVQIPVVAAENRGQDQQNRRTASPHPRRQTYVGAVEIAEEFGYRIYTEAWRRGWEWATTKIVIGDGAVWIWNLADRHFPGAIQIVDLYPARQHLWDIAALLYPHDATAKKRWMAPMK